MKTVKFKTVAKFFFVLITIIFITISCSHSSSSKSNVEKTAIKTEIKNEIRGVYGLFKTVYPSDGEYDSESDYNDVIEKIEYEEFKEDESFYYCYDTQNLIKIEVIANINNARILYKYPLGEMVSLFEGDDINGQFVIIPDSSNNYLNGGTIIIKSADKVLREIIIEYDGCL